MTRAEHMNTQRTLIGNLLLSEYSLKKGTTDCQKTTGQFASYRSCTRLFSKVVCEKVKGVLNLAQSTDQAGFRPGYNCDDHLFAISILAEKCNEFNIPMWIATLDFKKAFDSILHPCIWQAMIALSVPPIYVGLLSTLSDGQRTSVRADGVSREFDIRTGTKLGGPISPVVFNSVLEEAMRKVKAKWLSK